MSLAIWSKRFSISAYLISWELTSVKVDDTFDEELFLFGLAVGLGTHLGLI